MRARCISCGAARAKNTTRQVEHLQQCPQFLNSADGQDAISDGLLTERPIEASANTNGTRDIWKGGAPNPNLSTNRTKPRHSGGRPTITPNRPAASKSPAPSLVNYLLAKNYAAVDVATEQPFLSHAGCGTLSTAALEQWLTQQGHMSREFTIFIGSVIGKIRLTNTDNPQGDTAWRTLDLLVSTLNNAKRELEFLRTTQYKYGLQSDSEPPKPVTKGLIDLFKSAASPTSSLLESMVVVWAVEHVSLPSLRVSSRYLDRPLTQSQLYNVSWQYAAKLIQADQPPSTNYSVPEYVGVSMYGVHASQPQSLKKYDETHTAALHEALIPNWTSLGFSKFVDACKAIVDELANNETSGNGAGELGRYDVTFRQVVWLWKQSWPEVTGMGEEDEDAEMGEEGQSQAGGNAENDGPIEIQDDDDAGRDEDAPTADSPYGGTGLGAVAAANRGP